MNLAKTVNAVLIICLCLPVAACHGRTEIPSALYNPGPLLEEEKKAEEKRETDIADVLMPQGAVQGSGKPYTVRGRTYYPLKSSHGFVETGIASWYGPRAAGQRTSSKERYDPGKLTAAHRILPLGRVVTVTNLKNGKSVQVRINDRGPFKSDRVIDLSLAAAKKLDMLRDGIVRVRVQSVGTLTAHVERNGDIRDDFYIQVRSFHSASAARRLMTQLRKKGYNTRSVSREDRDITSVQVGPWKDLFAAEHALSRLKKEFPGAFVMGR